VQLGGEPHLGVDHAVIGQVLGRFPGDAVERFRCLHHADGVPEGVQVEVEMAAVGARGERRGELIGIARRQAGIPGFVGQVDDRLRPQPAVQVVVQQDLGHGADLRDAGAHRVPQCSRAPAAAGWHDLIAAARPGGAAGRGRPRPWSLVACGT
jgi:hypothetical protein